MALFGKKDKDEESVATIELSLSQAVTPEAPSKPRSGYTVEDAIALMRKLPVDPQNVQLVIQVVRSTLASMNVRVEDIIEDANQRQSGLEEKILKSRAQITELEKQIASHRQEIARLEADLSETVAVKERLELGEVSSASPAATSAAASAAAPRLRPALSAAPAPKPRVP
jgi:septal ring factor EnvC (AmiA/AmiB activator)